MDCRAFNLGQRCTRPTQPGSPYALPTPPLRPQPGCQAVPTRTSSHQSTPFDSTSRHESKTTQHESMTGERKNTARGQCQAVNSRVGHCGSVPVRAVCGARGLRRRSTKGASDRSWPTNEARVVVRCGHRGPRLRCGMTRAEAGARGLRRGVVLGAVVRTTGVPGAGARRPGSGWDGEASESMT
jgi:hypothetical protein